MRHMTGTQADVAHVKGLAIAASLTIDLHFAAQFAKAAVQN